MIEFILKKNLTDSVEHMKFNTGLKGKQRCEAKKLRSEAMIWKYQLESTRDDDNLKKFLNEANFENLVQK